MALASTGKPSALVVDAHCHAGPGDGMTDPWNTDAPLEAYLRRADRAGIGRTVVFAAFNHDYASANARVAEIVRKAAPRLIGFTFVHCRRDAGRIRAMVGEGVHRHGFRGVKVHGYDALPNRELCNAAREFSLPVLVDVVGRPEVIDMIAPQYPDVSFIVPHLGSFADDWRAQHRVVDQLVRYPNVYADTSGVRRFDYVVEAVKRAGPGKVIFGSDGPWLHPGLELHKVRLLGLAPEAEAQVLGGNILRLIAGKAGRTLDVAA
ncbi:amidohydrolase family protein [Bradyrhizobium japonicum]|uniref:amidohydrolase family protein n=1 Tax=Bradyrhizobium japonicum TaxID=375 RepID=UPI0027147EDB|nr:amidohydrolase family protein [Bradyrhizobium japonicum]WLB58024.1 amidohydrolase family protein [Bradyrhizobium japonicum]WLB60109.1 amidohydrolase family protein [Bradyrhizobium japonicum]